MSRILAGLFRPLAVFVAFCFFFVAAAVMGYHLGYDSIPAVSVLYGATNVEWLARARFAVGASVVLMMFVGSFVLMSTYDKWTSVWLRMRTFIFSALLMCTGFWNITIMGLVVYGGVWHFMSFAAGIIEALVAGTAIAILFVTQHKSLDEETNLVG